MDIKVYPSKLKGTVKAPPSKSMAHRAIICAALAEGESVIHGVSGSEDMEATIGCMRGLGAHIARGGAEGDVIIRGIGGRQDAGGDSGSDRPVLDCIESGSTLRFVLPVAGALGRTVSFTGRGKLPERPMTPLADEMKKNGVTFLPEGRDRLPFAIQGGLMPGVYEIPGDVSSQYISGLIFALPMLGGDSQIRIKGTLESAGYIGLTLQMVSDFGIVIEETDYGFFIPGGQKYIARECEVEGDYSNAAFWLAAAACGAELTVTGLRPDSRQGDRSVADILKRAGAVDVAADRSGDGTAGNPEAADGLTLTAAEGLSGIDVDCRDIPDIVPVLSVCAAAADGRSRFFNAGRLRLKESDRLAAMADCLSRLGADIEESGSELVVYGSRFKYGHMSGEGLSAAAEDGGDKLDGRALRGGCEVSGYNDHRIVMSMAIAALLCCKPVVIRGAEAVAKSYPDFFEEYRRLGGVADVVTDR